jgi:hypothetical protein
VQGVPSPKRAVPAQANSRYILYKRLASAELQAQLGQGLKQYYIKPEYLYY